MKNYRKIANIVNAYQNCEKNNNYEWRDRHAKTLKELESQLPSGSGFDSGTQIVKDECSKDKIVLSSAYHVMNPNGYYCGWLEFDITVEASLLYEITLGIVITSNTVNSGDPCECSEEDKDNDLCECHWFDLDHTLEFIHTSMYEALTLPESVV